MSDEETPPAAPGAEQGPLRSRRRLILGGVLVAIFAGVLLVGLWARNSVFSADTTGENFTTTTDPFAHVDRNQSSDDVAAESSNEVSPDAEIIQPAGWSYVNSYDQVRGGTIYRAELDSENSAYFDFPYQGGSTLTMTVRKHPQYGDDVIFKISKGQFVCGVDDCSGTMNFGGGPEAFSLSEPTDNSSDTLFASNGSYIIEQLKKAKKIIVELPFYQEGNQQFVFEMKSPLSWPPKGSELAHTPAAPPVVKPSEDEPTQQELDKAFPPPKPSQVDENSVHVN